MKRQNCGDSKKISVCRGLVGREAQIGRAERIFRTLKIFFMISQLWIHVIIHSSKPMECTTPRMKPKVNYRLWVILSM